jgi:ubiquitin-conjugating enzyme E2 D/E
MGSCLYGSYFLAFKATKGYSRVEGSALEDASDKVCCDNPQKQFTVRLVSGDSFSLDASNMKHGFELREAIAKVLAVGVHRVCLIVTFQELQDSDALADVGDSEVLAVVRGFDPQDPETSACFLKDLLQEAQGSVPDAVQEVLASQNCTESDASRITLKRIQQELKIQHRPGIAIEVVNDNIFHWRAIVLGPGSTPYENAAFECHILIPTNYPAQAPQVYFATEIYHCNVDAEGWLQQGLVAFDYGWTIQSFLLLIISLMADPCLECISANPGAAELCAQDRAAYDAKARECTAMHAQLSL